MKSTITSVFIVMKEFPYIYTEIEKVFSTEEAAIDYILETYPYYTYYDNEDFYAMPDLKDDSDNAERYFILERPVQD